MRNSRTSGLMAAAMAVVASSGFAMADSAVSQQLLRSAFGTVGSWSGRSSRKGWSVATDRRRAKKARNAARNRAAYRGKA